MILFNVKEHGHALGVLCRVIFNPAADRVISTVTQEGNIKGGVLYTDYSGHSICIHQASVTPKWVEPDLLWVAFHYPFVKLGCKVLFGPVPETDTRTIAINERLGFKEVCRIPGVFEDGALVIMAMSKDECKWLSLKPRTLKAA